MAAEVADRSLRPAAGGDAEGRRPPPAPTRGRDCADGRDGASLRCCCSRASALPRRCGRWAQVETFVRLTQASTNYVALGEAGFAALTRLRARRAGAGDRLCRYRRRGRRWSSGCGRRRRGEGGAAARARRWPIRRRCCALDAAGWQALLTAARAELLLGSLAARVRWAGGAGGGGGDPRRCARVGRAGAACRRCGRRRWRGARWPTLDVPVVLLKGTAFVAAGLDAGGGAVDRRSRHPRAARRARSRSRRRCSRRGGSG